MPYRYRVCAGLNGAVQIQGVRWIRVAQDRGWLRVLVNALINVRVP